MTRQAYCIAKSNGGFLLILVGSIPCSQLGIHKNRITISCGIYGWLKRRAFSRIVVCCNPSSIPAVKGNNKRRARVISLGSIPYLVLVALTPHPTVTYIILNWRMHQLGGERYCRQQLRQFEAAGLLELHDGQGQDRREKQVRLTVNGKAELQRLRELLAKLDSPEKSAQRA